MRLVAALLFLVPISICATPMVSAEPMFMGLGTLPGRLNSHATAVSYDGHVVVGYDEVDGGADQAWRWTSAGGMVPLGDLPGGDDRSFAADVSGDGSVIVGVSDSASGQEAFRWTISEGMIGLGDLAGGAFRSVALGVSGDGSVVVGRAESSDYEAFRWTADTGMVGLGVESGAWASSENGSVLVGYMETTLNDPHEAFRWTAATGWLGLGDLDGGIFNSHALDVSADGSVIVGTGHSALGSEGFRWTEEDGMVGLGVLPGWSMSVNRAVSGDGSVIVGESFDGTTSTREILIWDETNGMRPLEDLLVDSLGLDLAGWDLVVATDISYNGTTIVGWGFHHGVQEAWIAVIPEPGAAPCDDALDNDGDGFTDYPDDPGCADVDDLSEHSPLLICDDGSDNDGDGFIDYPADPGCFHLGSNLENPQCQDGVNNDLDTGIDFDGGESVWGIAVDQPDPQCVGMPWKNWETRRGGSCGIGVELVLLLPPLMWLWRRRRS